MLQPHDQQRIHALAVDQLMLLRDDDPMVFNRRPSKRDYKIIVVGTGRLIRRPASRATVAALAYGYLSGSLSR